MPAERQRLLLSAYACEPGKGSEPGVGWNWLRQAVRFHQVWVITRANNRRQIEQARAAEDLGDLQVIYFDLPRWAGFWKKGQRGMHLYYYLWQAGAYLLARRLHRRVGFSLVHHVTFVNYWMPSFLSLLPAPFVWGPVGGGESAPPSFRKRFGWRGRLYETARNVARGLGGLDPFVRLTARRSELAYATTPETAEQLRRLGCRRVLLLSEAGLAAGDIEELARLPLRSRGPFRLMSSGRLLHWKGFELGLRAFASFHQDFPDSEYWVAGGGPERERLERTARELGVGGHVRFLGVVPRRQVIEAMGECDVLVHPSLHDSGGWVCLEAMAAGRPVVCLDLGGPGVQVTAETGIKVPAGSPEQAVGEMAGALRLLAGNPDLRARMAAAGRARVAAQFNWEYKAEYSMQMLAHLAAERGKA